ncbi:MAG: epoxyqueuosine reductase QueH [Dehalococcoidales bacterium]|nr:epoxyqueuosine reductase QueH [Dehalococcoidales bacterium]
MRVLLHICCGVCAAGAAERLFSEGHEVVGYFYNPNIYPEEEYLRRLDAASRVAEEMGFTLVEGPFNPDDWNEAIKHLEDEPEGGKRCAVCFRFRLEQTYRYLNESGCDFFTTTLTISPHKSAEVINRTGREIAGEKFMEKDFKKKAGFQKANELAKNWGIYRQNYCGCRYSMKNY